MNLARCLVAEALARIAARAREQSRGEYGKFKSGVAAGGGRVGVEAQTSGNIAGRLEPRA